MLLHGGVEARDARSEGMRDREACSQASFECKETSRAELQDIQAMDIAGSRDSQRGYDRKVGVTTPDRISMWKARRNGVIFAWKRGSQASSLRENGSFGLSSLGRLGRRRQSHDETRAAGNRRHESSRVGLSTRHEWRGRAGRDVRFQPLGSNWRSSRKVARPQAEVLSGNSTRPIGCRRSIVIC